MRIFGTYFDGNYLSRALALHESLKAHAGPFRLHALCWDERALAGLRALALPEVVPVTPEEVEAHEPRLRKAREGRSTIEYYYTCGPAFMSLVLDREIAADWITYLDADLYFFSSPDPIYEELAGSSVGIVPHRFSPGLEHLSKFGRFNVGWVSFRRDAAGRACLGEWKERCLEWCFDFVDRDRFADQGYLDEWPERHSGVRVIQHPGADVAPWNLGGHHLTEGGGRLQVDGRPLVFFHFHGFKQVFPWLYDTNLGAVGMKPSALLKRALFGPYLDALLRHASGGDTASSGRNPDFRNRWRSALKKLRHATASLLRGSYLIRRS